MNIRTYSQISVQLYRSTYKPSELIHMAAQHCMQQPENIKEAATKEELLAYLLNADHGNPLEHLYYTFKVDGLSRSGLAQLTRHRIASYTVTSQHYQNYSRYPFIISEAYQKHSEWDLAFSFAMRFYQDLIAKGVPKEEARQVLPNAMSCGFVFSINGRSLVNFLRLRLCKRNCEEIINLAWEIKYQVQAHFPELWSKVHTMCVMDGKCNQGVLSCGRPYEKA